MRQVSPLFTPDCLSGPRHSDRLLPSAACGSVPSRKGRLARALRAAVFALPLTCAALAAGAQEDDGMQGPPPAGGTVRLPTSPDPVPLPQGDPKDADDGFYGPAPAPAPAQGRVTGAYSGSMEPCLQGHGQRDLYRAGLQAMGWVDISEAGRPVAIAMLADAFLPITGAMNGPWEEHLAHRPASHAFWADMAQNRTLMEREGRILLLAGFLDPNGEMRVECWSAGPETPATESFFLLAGQVWQSEGVTMTQLNIPATAATPETDILVSRITPPAPMQPPLAASDGLRTTTIFPMNGSPL